MKTETQRRLYETINAMERRVKKNLMTTENAEELIRDAEKLLSQSEEVRKARDKWKKKYEELKLKQSLDIRNIYKVNNSN